MNSSELYKLEILSDVTIYSSDRGGRRTGPGGSNWRFKVDSLGKHALECSLRTGGTPMEPGESRRITICFHFEDAIEQVAALRSGDRFFLVQPGTGKTIGEAVVLESIGQ